MAAAAASPRRARFHLVAGIVVVMLLPAASWLDGSGQLAWTMFSRTGRYRLVLSADGLPVNSTELAAAAAPGPTSTALAGADRLKHHDVARATLRRHFEEVVAHTCRLRPGATTIRGRLEEQVRRSDAVRSSEVSVTCTR
jgi:hypothetical protein